MNNIGMCLQLWWRLNKIIGMKYTEACDVQKSNMWPVLSPHYLLIPLKLFWKRLPWSTQTWWLFSAWPLLPSKPREHPVLSTLFPCLVTEMLILFLFYLWPLWLVLALLQPTWGCLPKLRPPGTATCLGFCSPPLPDSQLQLPRSLGWIPNLSFHPGSFP